MLIAATSNCSALGAEFHTVESTCVYIGGTEANSIMARLDCMSKNGDLLKITNSIFFDGITTLLTSYGVSTSNYWIGLGHCSTTHDASEYCRLDQLSYEACSPLSNLF